MKIANRNRLITPEALRECISYNPKTGEFRWIKPTRSSTIVGSLAGSRSKLGRLVISINKTRYSANQLAYLYMTGKWADVVDHINRDPSDDRWINLRKATYRQNQGNRKLNKNSTCGFKGVWYMKKDRKYGANIGIGGKTKYLGRFNTAEDAHQAYLIEAEKHFGNQFARSA
jgi:hypothetical protein